MSKTMTSEQIKTGVAEAERTLAAFEAERAELVARRDADVERRRQIAFDAHAVMTVRRASAWMRCMTRRCGMTAAWRVRNGQCPLWVKSGH